MKTDVELAGATNLSRTDRGPGIALGAGPRFALTQHIGAGINVDYFQSTVDNHFIQLTGPADYDF